MNRIYRNILRKIRPCLLRHPSVGPLRGPWSGWLRGARCAPCLRPASSPRFAVLVRRCCAKMAEVRHFLAFARLVGPLRGPRSPCCAGGAARPPCLRPASSAAFGGLVRRGCALRSASRPFACGRAGPRPGNPRPSSGDGHLSLRSRCPTKWRPPRCARGPPFCPPDGASPRPLHAPRLAWLRQSSHDARSLWACRSRLLERGLPARVRAGARASPPRAQEGARPPPGERFGRSTPLRRLSALSTRRTPPAFGGRGTTRGASARADDAGNPPSVMEKMSGPHHRFPHAASAACGTLAVTVTCHGWTCDLSRIGCYRSSWESEINRQETQNGKSVVANVSPMLASNR
jgi:hypothetical protein